MFVFSLLTRQKREKNQKRENRVKGDFDFAVKQHFRRCAAPFAPLTIPF